MFRKGVIRPCFYQLATNPGTSKHALHEEHQMLDRLTNPKPGHTTGGSGRGGARRGSGAGQGGAGRDAIGSVRPGNMRPSCIAGG